MDDYDKTLGLIEVNVKETVEKFYNKLGVYPMQQFKKSLEDKLFEDTSKIFTKFKIEFKESSLRADIRKIISSCIYKHQKERKKNLEKSC